MEKTTENEIKLEAERILKEYAYLDKLDELNGWAWECLRRSKEYRDFNDQAESVKLIFEDKHAGENKAHLNTFWELFNEYTNFFESGFPFVPLYAEVEHELSFLKKIEAPGFISIHKFKEGGQWETWMIPRYNRPYNLFNEFDGKPKIKGSSPFKLLPHIPGGLDKNLKKIKDWALRIELMDLPIGTLGFNLIISNKARMRDIEADLVSEIKRQIYREQHLQELAAPDTDKKKKLRNRGDKWKYYLIAYDLRESKKLDPDKIVKIFNSFPGKTGYIRNDIDRYYSEGIQLIEKGKYKEYLFF
jgi:hypothetical protein